MLAKLLRFCLCGLFLTGCSSLWQSMPSAPPALSTVGQPPSALSPLTAPAILHQVALLLPQQGDFANAGKAIQAGFNDAYQNSSNKPVIKIYDTTQGQTITALYDEAVKSGADFIIGPLEKASVASLQQRDDINVITIALNTTGNTSASPNLYQFALSPIDEAEQIADKAAQDGHHAALMITPAGNWGDSIAGALQQQWQANGGVIAGSLAVSGNNNLNDAIRQLLQAKGNTRRQDFDVIFLIAQPILARQIKPLLKFYYADDVPVYSTSLVYSGLVNSAADQDLNGIEFCDMPLVLEPQGQWQQVRQQMTLSQPGSLQQYVRLYGLGWDAALLTQQFNQLPTGIDGATGKLYLDNTQHILRHLTWASFVNGEATVTS